MLESGAACHGIVDAVFQGSRVGEIQALVHTQAQHPRTHHHGVALHVAEMLRACNQAHLGHVGAAGAVQIERQRQGHTDHQAGLHAHRECGHQRGQHRKEVGFRVAPSLAQDAEVHQRQNSHHDGGGQRSLRQVIQRRREEKGSQRDAGGREYAGCRRLRASVEVDHRAGKTAGDREAASERRAQVTRAQSH